MKKIIYCSSLMLCGFFRKLWNLLPSYLCFHSRVEKHVLAKRDNHQSSIWRRLPKKSVSRAESFVSVEECEEQRKGKNHPRIAILNRGVVSCHATWKSVVARLMKVITKSNWMNGWPCAPWEEVIDLNNFLI